MASLRLSMTAWSHMPLPTGVILEFILHLFREEKYVLYFSSLSFLYSLTNYRPFWYYIFRELKLIILSLKLLWRL